MALSEFRQDLLSGEWILFATGRAQRPHESVAPRQHQTRESCPFEDLSSQKVIWQKPELTLIENKYPAVHAGACGPDVAVGPFQTHAPLGEHDVFVYTDHDKQLSQFTPEEMLPVVRAYKQRMQELADLGGCTKYIMLFHNFGAEAGASISHPHSQIMSVPILPPSVARSLQGAHRYFKEYGKKAHEALVIWEREQNKRIIYENDYFIALCPFASKRAGEIRIFPKDFGAHFLQMPEELEAHFAEIMSVVLHKLAVALHEPAFNFYIHTAPTESALGNLHEFYTWHVEIIPKIKIDAGIELGSGIEVNMIDPDELAASLRAVL